MNKKRMISACIVLSMILSGLTLTSLAKEEKVVEPISFFEIEGATAELTDQSLDFKLTGETATIRFKNPLAASGFSLNWNGVNDSEKKLEKLEMLLADSQDSSCSVKLTFGKLSDEYISVKYNEEARSYLTAGATYAENETDVSVKFNEATNSFTDDAGAYKITAENCMNGEKFYGFDSMGVMLTMTVTGKNGATFRLKSINGQSFGKDYVVDNVEPLLCVPTGQMKMIHNAVAVLPKAAAFDVFTEKTSLELTVKDPDGEIVTDETGKKLENVDGNSEYQIRFSKYGQYRIVYVASDGTNKTRGMGYQISVQDVGAPEVTLKKEMKVKATVGAEVVFPEMVVKDNVSKEFTTWINVLYPNGYMTCEKTSFTPDTEGEYRITFCAQDESGNIGRFVTSIYAERSGKE